MLPGKPQDTHLKLLLWLPPFLHACITWPLLWLDPQLQYTILLNSESPDGIYNLWRLMLGDIELLFTIVHLALCLYLSLRLVHRHREQVLQQFSSIERRSLDWLRNVLMATLLVYLLWLLEEFFSADLLSGNEFPDIALGLSMVALIYTLGWMGLRQPQIFMPRGALQPGWEPDNLPTQETSPGKYARSALSAELAASLMENLQALMSEQRPYLDPDLSLGELAATLGVSSNYLSQAINQQTGSNFFDLINGYRIQHAMTMLAQGDDNILDIAMTAGFNSKSAFYSAFRKQQQMTPGQYRKLHSSHRGAAEKELTAPP